MAAAVAASLFARAVTVRAEAFARESLPGGHVVELVREADGDVSFVLDAAGPVRLGTTDTPRMRRVPQGADTALVVEGATGGALAVFSASRAPAVLFAGPFTAIERERDGVAARTVIVVDDFDGDGRPDVVLGTRRADVTIAGAEPLVTARVVVNGALRPVRLNPLRTAGAARTGAPTPDVRARTPRASEPAPRFAEALAIRWPSAFALASSEARALTDGDPRTFTTAPRFSFVAARNDALAGVAFDRIELVAPPLPHRLPSHVTLVLDASGSRIGAALPTQSPPGARIVIPLDPPRTVRDLALVVDAEEPAAAIAGIALGGPLDASADPFALLVPQLAGPDGDRVADLLVAHADEVTPALVAALPSLETDGVRRAVRILASSARPEAAAAIAGLVDRRELEVEVRAALVRQGARALAPLRARVATDLRAAERVLALGVPAAAKLDALAPLLVTDAAHWHEARPVLAVAVAQAAREDALVGWVTSLGDDHEARARALAIAAECATSGAQQTAIAALARGLEPVTFADRYRLARAIVGDAAGVALVTPWLHDPDPDLRAMAARALSAGDASGPTREALRAALGDSVPRVRTAAVLALRNDATARAALIAALDHDAWPSVRIAVATSLAGTAANAPALVHALDDRAVPVVRAVVAALGRTPGRLVGPALMAFAEDSRRNPELRREALERIGLRCDHALADRLLALFLRDSDPVLDPTDNAVAHAALFALAHIDPARTRREMVAFHMNEGGRTAVERAMRESCPVAPAH